MKKNFSFRLNIIFSLLFILLTFKSFTLSQYQPSVQPFNQCSTSLIQGCLNDIRQLIRSMPMNFVSNNPVSDMDLNIGESFRGSNKLRDKCDNMRKSLQCVLTYSGPCFITNTVHLNTDLGSAEQFMVSFCNRAYHYSKMLCYTNNEMRQCESYLKPGQVIRHYTDAANYCPNYFTFLTCAKRNIAKCPIADQGHESIYLLDKGRDLAWQCGNDVNLFGHSSTNQWPYPDSGHSNYPINHQGGYNYYPNYNSPSYNQPYLPGSLNNPASTYQPGGSYPGGSILNPDRPIRDQYSLLPTETCIEKANYHIRHCEDNYYREQGGYSRNSYDQQRKQCCSLYHLEECLHRTVYQNCRQQSPTVVDYFMGQQRKNDLTMNCRDHPRHYCSSGSNIYLSSIISILTALTALYSSL